MIDIEQLLILPCTKIEKREKTRASGITVST